jgi:hypothetical protein
MTYNAKLVQQLNNYILSNYLFTDMEGKVHVSSSNHGDVQGWSAQKLVITDGITVIAAYPPMPNVPQIDLSDIRRWIEMGCKKNVELEMDIVYGSYEDYEENETVHTTTAEPLLTNNTVKMVWGEVEWKLTDGIVPTRLENGSQNQCQVKLKDMKLSSQDYFTSTYNNPQGGGGQ